MTNEEMLKLYAEGKNYDEIGKLAGLNRHTVSARIRAAGGTSRSPSERKLGDKNPAWRGGRITSDPRGYVLIYEGRRKYRYEHRVVMDAVVGRRLDSTEHVHHDNEKKNDNSPDNLKLTTNEKHRAEHHQMQGWALDYDKCQGCGTTEVSHFGHGLCQRCYGIQNRGGEPLTSPAKPAEDRRWARDHDCCRVCGKTEKRHGGFGLCSGCKSKAWKADHRS